MTDRNFRTGEVVRVIGLDVDFAVDLPCIETEDMLANCFNRPRQKRYWLIRIDWLIPDWVRFVNGSGDVLNISAWPTYLIRRKGEAEEAAERERISALLADYEQSRIP